MYQHFIGIRLRGSSSEGVGRVEIYHLGRWGTVCGDTWTLSNAHVVCHQLGFDGARTPLCCGLFGKGSGRVWLSGLHCVGSESSLALCPNPGWGNNHCGHENDAGVVCKTSKALEKGNDQLINIPTLTRFSKEICLRESSYIYFNSRIIFQFVHDDDYNMHGLGKT